MEMGFACLGGEWEWRKERMKKENDVAALLSYRERYREKYRAWV